MVDRSDLVVVGGEQKVINENNDGLILDIVEEFVADSSDVASGVLQDQCMVAEVGAGIENWIGCEEVVLESVDQEVVDASSILSGIVQGHDLVLDTENVNQFCLLVEDPDCPKKSRAAVNGVSIIMDQLKPKGKGGGNKRKDKIREEEM
ncbi:hypothetical protein V6N12_042596 [Hibiscus sabdariffa]|uniref:Uncharacterized protein n=1 Tax=Hibiscus sabdariffa TaxID=183260 RepID=A0ABR2EGR9_9ROSI